MLKALKESPAKLLKLIGLIFFLYLFFGFMLLPCLNTLTSIFSVKDAAGNPDPWAVIRFFRAGNMGKYVLNSLKLAICLVITVNVVEVDEDELGLNGSYACGALGQHEVL